MEIVTDMLIPANAENNPIGSDHPQQSSKQDFELIYIYIYIYIYHVEYSQIQSTLSTSFQRAYLIQI